MKKNKTILIIIFGIILILLGLIIYNLNKNITIKEYKKDDIYFQYNSNFKIKKEYNKENMSVSLNSLDNNSTYTIKIINREEIYANSSNQEIDNVVWEWFLSANMPSICQLKEKGYWNINVEHLVRMNLINQMCFVPQLQKIKDELLIQKVYVMCGNQIVKPAYDYAIEKIDELIEQSEDKVLVKR